MHKCWYCGKEEENNWCAPMKKELEEERLCFHCNFWINDVGKGEEEHLFVDGEAYCPKPYNSMEPEKFLGFSGHLFRFRKEDGTIIESNNVWSRGTIPERFRRIFPDNAEMLEVTPEDRKRLRDKYGMNPWR